MPYKTWVLRHIQAYNSAMWKFHSIRIKHWHNKPNNINIIVTINSISIIKCIKSIIFDGNLLKLRNFKLI